VTLVCLGTVNISGQHLHSDRGQGAHHEAFMLRGRRRIEQEEHRDESEVVQAGLLNVPLVDLQVESAQWRITKLLVPVLPEVAKWWTEEDRPDVTARLDHSLTGHSGIHLDVTGRESLEVAGVRYQGIHSVIHLPDTAVIEACNVGSVRVVADFEPLASMGPIRAVLVICPVRNSGGGALATAKSVLSRQHPFRWLLLPWLLLLMPFIVGSSIGPMALLGGAVLTLAAIACISFIIAVLIMIVQRRCAVFARRWRRLSRLRALARRPAHITAAFGDAGPCCICLGDPDEREKLIALLPCRHALHSECYSSWVGAESYPSYDLICPLCRRRAEAIGKLRP